VALTEEMLSRTRQARAAGVNERLTKPWRSRDIAATLAGVPHRAA
jgi:hypothetical protein